MHGFACSVFELWFFRSLPLLATGAQCQAMASSLSTKPQDLGFLRYGFGAPGPASKPRWLGSRGMRSSTCLFLTPIRKSHNVYYESVYRLSRFLDFYTWCSICVPSYDMSTHALSVLPGAYHTIMRSLIVTGTT